MSEALERHHEGVEADRYGGEGHGDKGRRSQHKAQPLEIGQLMAPIPPSGRSSVRNAVAARTRSKILDGASPLACAFRKADTASGTNAPRSGVPARRVRHSSSDPQLAMKKVGWLEASLAGGKKGWLFIVAPRLAIRKRRLRKPCQIVWSLTVVITGVCAFPSNESQRRVAPVHPGQPATRAEHVHLDGLGGQPQSPRDLLGLEMRGNQPENLPLPGGKLFESGTGTLDHSAKMSGDLVPV